MQRVEAHVEATPTSTASRERQLRELLGRYEILPFDPGNDFDNAVWFYRQCREAGATPRGLVDCLIAAVAWRTGAVLLTRDVDMERLAAVAGIALDPASTA
ncbi:MAG: PIN domain-containing protein [Chloroflexi bacterium]|nr:PIN domain-containing protein [Chloroflexota bacterium]